MINAKRLNEVFKIFKKNYYFCRLNFYNKYNNVLGKNLIGFLGHYIKNL